MKWIFRAWLVFLWISLWASSAAAQYKNLSFGADGSAWFAPIKGNIQDVGNTLKLSDNRGLRLSLGGKFGVEYNQKIDHDHWWVSFRGGLGFLSFAPKSSDSKVLSAFDSEAQRTLGTILAVDTQVGVRYIFSTDQIRPYMQLGVSFTWLASLSSRQNEACVDTICESTNESNAQAYLSHPYLPGVQVRHGIEWIVVRDFAIHIFLDAHLLLPINADPYLVLMPSLGILFFS
jgi:hypothetical protein